MCIYCLNRLLQSDRYRAAVASPATGERDVLQLLKVPDVDTSHAALAMVVSEPRLTAALEDDKFRPAVGCTLEEAMEQRHEVLVPLGPFEQKLRFADLLSDAVSSTLGTCTDRVRTFLYFQGLLTIAQERKVNDQQMVALWLPNITFADFYLTRYVSAVENRLHRLLVAVRRPSSESWRRGLQEVFCHPDGALSNSQFFNEASMQAAIVSALRVAVHLLRETASIVAEPLLQPGELEVVDADVVAEAGVSMKCKSLELSEMASDKRKALRGDILISVDCVPVALLELKRVFKTKVRRVPGYTQKSVQRILSLAAEDDDASIPVEMLMTAELVRGYSVTFGRHGPTRVGTDENPVYLRDVQQGAATQVRENYDLLRCGGGSSVSCKGIALFTVLLVGTQVVVHEVVL